MNNNTKKIEKSIESVKSSLPGNEASSIKLRVVEDVYQKGSSEGGIKGLFETVLRKFRVATHALALIPLYIGASICIGLSLQPSILFFTLD